MNCEIAHERIVSAAYGELSDEQIHELERHMTGCPECHSEREELLALKLLAAAHPMVEPPANLVARSRQRLEEALDALPPKRWYEWLGQRMINNFASLQAAPVAASAVTAESKVETPTPAPTEIASISSIVRQPNSDVVEVHYNQVVPRQVEGSIDDPAISDLLMLASENSPSPDVRDDSIGLMAAECRAGHGCKAAGIRDALMVALRYDKNEGVREKALQGLEPYVAQDVRVRDAVLEALLNDADPRIRTAAINILEPVEADASVRQVLHSVANSDHNPQIRTVSRQVLSRVSEIQ